MCINNLPPPSLFTLCFPPFFPGHSITFVSCKATPLPSQHPPYWYRSRASLAPCFHNDIYDIPTGLHRSDRTWVSSWICSANIGYGSLRVRNVKKPRRLRRNLRLDRGDELCGGARECARELEICIAGSTLGVLSVKRSRSAFCSPPERRRTRCLMTYLPNIVCLTHLVNHSPRRMLSARYDWDHVPRIPVPIHDRRLVSFALSHRLDFETEPVTGRPGARDVEFLGAVAAADHSAAFPGT